MHTVDGTKWVGNTMNVLANVYGDLLYVCLCLWVYNAFGSYCLTIAQIEHAVM